MWIWIISLILISSVSAWGKVEDVSFGALRPKLLLMAKADLFTVEAYPEMAMIEKTPQIDLKLNDYNQRPIHKNKLYRIALLRSFDTHNTYDQKSSGTVYDITVEELDKNLQPTGISLTLGAKANSTTIVANFMQIKDQLSMNPTLTTGRAQIGDHVINAFPVILNGKKIPAYYHFEVMNISKSYIPFTLSNKYTLSLKDIRTNKNYTISAPGLRSLPAWTLIVSPKNKRSFKIWDTEIYY